MNNQIFFFFYHFAHQSQVLDGSIVFFAVYFPYVVIILAGLFLLFHHEIFRADSPTRVFWEKKREILMVFFSGGTAWFIAVILKNLVQATRPFLSFINISPLFAETGFAFPSGHATFFSALAFSIFFLHKKAGYWFMFFALLIGVARIIGGVHFPVDILGGYALGFIVSYIFSFFY